jgi:hypothetical protein
VRSTGQRTLYLILGLSGCCRTAERPHDVPREPVADAAPAPGPAKARMAQVGTAGGDEAAPETVSPAHLPRSAADPSAIPSMVIRTGQASLRVDSLEPAVARIRQLAQRVGGFIANSQMQAGENQLRSATLEIRVPASRFDDLTGGLAPIGRVEYVNVSAEDVGEEFTDITARATNAHRLEQRLIDLLATRTGKLSDVLEIERELARVRESIERMEGRLRYLQAHVATSTLSVTVHEKAPLVGDTGSGSVLGEAFRQAWRNLVNLIAGFIESLGVLVPLAALGIAVLLGFRRLWRMRRNG